MWQKGSPRSGYLKGTMVSWGGRGGGSSPATTRRGRAGGASVCSRAGGPGGRQRPSERWSASQGHAWGGGGLSGMMSYIGAMLGVQPLDRRGPTLMNSAIFDLFKHFQMDLN
jgi:hypothetical protein